MPITGKVEARRAVRRGGGALTRPRILALGVIAIVITSILLAAGCQASGGQRLEWTERSWAVNGSERTIMDEWREVEAPAAPELHAVTVDPASTALLVLDMQNQNCSEARRPRCVASITTVRGLLDTARNAGAPVLYSLTSSAEPADIRGELTPRADEPVVKSGVDKFHGTDLEALLREKGVQAVILVGTSAHGAVLHTATGAALRGFDVIVPVDGMSAGEPYAEQYTSWHLANGPGTRRRCTLTRCSMISFTREGG